MNGLTFVRVLFFFFAKIAYLLALKFKNLASISKIEGQIIIAD